MVENAARAQTSLFTPAELRQFATDGYAIVRGLASSDLCARIRDAGARDLAAAKAPLEYEASVGYPGAPQSLDAAGGRTVRRLLGAVDRDDAMRDWACGADAVARMAQLLGGPPVLSRAHHNCLMTKHPDFGSQTNWHRDIRYWSFARPELVSLWLALGSERPENGGLFVLPGTHVLEIEPERYDAAKFLRPDLAANQALIATKRAVELEAGDALFFHSRLFHAAGRNASRAVKFSLVYTYRAADNPPLAGTRSAASPEIFL
ncbi:MAG: phytanoyl-CoA dioxygenase family protein [Rhodospirillales bacterium]|jgi:phytanoyl-CoA hydroxylase